MGHLGDDVRAPRILRRILNRNPGKNGVAAGVRAFPLKGAVPTHFPIPGVRARRLHPPESVMRMTRLGTIH